MVTGVGSRANFEQCGKLLVPLKEAGAIITWEEQTDNGAYYVQLAPPAQAEPCQPFACTNDLSSSQAEPPRPSAPTHDLPSAQSLFTHDRVTLSQPAFLTSSGIFDVDAWLKENGWDFTAPSQ